MSLFITSNSLALNFARLESKSPYSYLTSYSACCSECKRDLVLKDSLFFACTLVSKVYLIATDADGVWVLTKDINGILLRLLHIYDHARKLTGLALRVFVIISHQQDLKRLSLVVAYFTTRSKSNQ